MVFVHTFLRLRTYICRQDEMLICAFIGHDCHGALVSVLAFDSRDRKATLCMMADFSDGLPTYVRRPTAETSASRARRIAPVRCH